MIWLFHILFYQPLYNGLILLMDIIPGGDIGVAVIIFTIIVKMILFPLSYKATKTQILMKNFEPELKKIKEKHSDKQEQALKTMELYKKAGINPFASFFLVFIQLPILIALYYTFLNSGLPVLNESLIYPFIHLSKPISMTLFGFMNIANHSLILSLLAAVATFLQMKLSAGTVGPKQPGASFGDDLARTMSVQMKYIYPIIVFVIAYRLSGAVALYWVVSNLFSVVQDRYARWRIKTVQKPLELAEQS